MCRLHVDNCVPLICSGQEVTSFQTTSYGIYTCMCGMHPPRKCDDVCICTHFYIIIFNNMVTWFRVEIDAYLAMFPPQKLSPRTRNLWSTVQSRTCICDWSITDNILVQYFLKNLQQ